MSASIIRGPRPKQTTHLPAVQIAPMVGLSHTTILEYFRKGIIPAKVAVGRCYRFDLEEVQSALKAHAAAQQKGAGK